MYRDRRHTLSDYKMLTCLYLSVELLSWFFPLSFSGPSGLCTGPLPNQVHWWNRPADLPWVQLGLRTGLGRHHLHARGRHPLLPPDGHVRGRYVLSPLSLSYSLYLSLALSVTHTHTQTNQYSHPYSGTTTHTHKHTHTCTHIAFLCHHRQA